MGRRRNKEKELDKNPIQADHDPVFEAAQKLTDIDLLRRDKELQKAKRLCTDLLKQHPDYVGALHSMGMILYDLGQFEKSLVPLSKANALCPEYVPAAVGLARASVQLGRIEYALGLMEQAERINPADVSVVRTLAMIWKLKRNCHRAIEYYRRLTELDPNDLGALESLVLFYTEAGQLENAGNLCNELVRTGRANIGVLSCLSTLPVQLVEVDLLTALDSQDLLTDECERAANFVKANVYHKQNEPELAWEKILLANAAMAQEDEAYWEDKKQEREVLQSDIQALANGNQTPQFDAADWPTTLFILGPSRAGKSTFEKFMCANNLVTAGFESTLIADVMNTTMLGSRCININHVSEMPASLLPDFRKTYRRELEAHLAGGTVLVNTHPGMLFILPWCCQNIPNFNIVFVKRERLDLIFSSMIKNYHAVSPNNHFSVPLLDEYLDWYYGTADALTAQVPDICRTICYEDMIEDPATAVKMISTLCGIEPQVNNLPSVGDDRGVAAPYKTFIQAALTRPA